MKYMLDKLIIMCVNTTIKSNLCVMYHKLVNRDHRTFESHCIDVQNQRNFLHDNKENFDIACKYSLFSDK